MNKSLLAVLLTLGLTCLYTGESAACSREETRQIAIDSTQASYPDLVLVNSRISEKKDDYDQPNGYNVTIYTNNPDVFVAVSCSWCSCDAPVKRILPRRRGQ